MEGLILKRFIENQNKPKVRIAKDLGMTKQNLYQLFESEKLTDSTIENIENVFKVKWSQIKASVNIDDNIAQQEEQAKIEPKNSLKIDFKDKYIASLERENSRLQTDVGVNLKKMEDDILLNRAMGVVIRDMLFEILARQRKSTIELIAEEKNRQLGELIKKAPIGSSWF